MAIETLQFLDKQSIHILVTQLLSKVNLRVDDRIIQAVDENSTDKQVISAKALYELLSSVNTDIDTSIKNRIDEHDVQLGNQATAIGNLNTTQTEQDGKLSDIENNIMDLGNNVNGLTHLTIETVTGSITTVTEPATDVLYFQRDNEADTMWMLYIYKNSQWVNIGDTEVDLSGIWSKNEVEELKEALGMHNVEGISDQDIFDIIDDVLSENPLTFDTKITPVGSANIDVNINYGDLLSEHPITGTMSDKDGNTVPGTFSWVTTDEEFIAACNSTVYSMRQNKALIPNGYIDVKWRFTPNDTETYVVKTGTITLVVDAANIENVPVPSSVVTYTGEEQSPEWDIYDENKMTISGTLSATEIGVYEVTFTPKFGYEWSDDGDVSPKTSYWSIVDPIPLVLTSDNHSWIGYTHGTDTNLNIPEVFTYDGVVYRVVGIGDNAFKSSKVLKTVTLPNSITTINSYAFYDCNALSSINIPKSCTMIGDNAFSATILTNITLPGTLSSIGEYVFSGCKSLTSVIIENGIKTIGARAFNGCVSLTSIQIPDTVTSIGDSAFYGCKALNSITLSNNITSIANQLFYNCTALTSIIIPDKVTIIDANSFNKCSNLASVVIPTSVSSIKGSAFYSCNSLSDVYYRGTEEQWAAISIGSSNKPLTSASKHYNYEG